MYSGKSNEVKPAAFNCSFAGTMPAVLQKEAMELLILYCIELILIV